MSQHEKIGYKLRCRLKFIGDAAVFGARLGEPQLVRIFPDASIYFARTLTDEAAAGLRLRFASARQDRPALCFQSAARSAGVEAGQKLITESSRNRILAGDWSIKGGRFLTRGKRC